MKNHTTEQKLLLSPTGPIWEKIGIKKRHGINIPLFSIHTAASCGIGEYLDLIPLIDWCKTIPIDVIQLLPLNDSEKDPSPYNAVSACALHPISLSLHALPHLDKIPELQVRMKEMQRFNSSTRVEYHEIRVQKMYWLKDYWEVAQKKIESAEDYDEFVKQNSWVKEYALFLVLKQKLEYTNWHEWPKELLYLNPEEFESLCKEHEQLLSFYIGLQYLCFDQLKTVKAYANKNGILLKGDVPILISPDSADVWMHKNWFDQNYAAGAPPDYYNTEGQYWGFPLFAWDQLEKDDYLFWQQRLKVAANFYNIYRIDHIVGFFRIWAIGLGKPAREGKFIPENPGFWIRQGSDLLRMLIRFSEMLPIGEDLGVIPKEVRTCMEEFGICGTKITRWSRDWDQDAHFYKLFEYPLASMSSVSTHDSETLSLWWRDCPEEALDYAQNRNWTYDTTLTQVQREYLLWESHHTSSLFHINLLPEYLALFPELVHPTIEAERINLPGTVRKENWTYRVLPSVEALQAHAPLLEKMRSIIFSPTPPTS